MGEKSTQACLPILLSVYVIVSAEHITLNQRCFVTRKVYTEQINIVLCLPFCSVLQMEIPEHGHPKSANGQ